MMDKMNKLVARTSHMALGTPPAIGLEPAIPHAAAVEESVKTLSPSVATYLAEIYKSLTASKTSKADFFEKVQRESSDNKDAADPLASLANFQAYMASSASTALQPAREQELTAPITDYFISSSHNTYLTGNQLYSDAAASSYTNVLLGGCRCVEIDVWDGEPENDSNDDTSDSSSDEEKAPSKKKLEKQDTQTEKKANKSRSRMNVVSSKLEGLLNYKSQPQPQDAPAPDPALAPGSGDPAAPSAVVRVPSRPEPMVLHGHTLTKGATFRDVCTAIRDNAFVASDLPVIVSLEVHACLEQQQIMVEIMQETWKGLLVEITPDLLTTPHMPTLADLKRKILIKVKWAQPTGDGQAGEALEDTEELQLAERENSQGSNTSAPPKPSKILQALSHLAVYTKGFSFRHLDQPEAKVPGHVFSLSENAAKEISAAHHDALFEHNRSFFMRVYPYGLRVNSSNLDPTFHWRRGAQIVALNWQSLDMGTMLNHGMFRGEPGWVQKPQGYRSTDTSAAASIIRRDLDLSIEFFAGQDLCLPIGDTKENSFHPYVSCSLHVEQPGDDTGTATEDDTTDSTKNSYKRTTKSSVGVIPDFASQKVQFPPILGVIEELSFLRLKIKDNELVRDSLAAWTCIRLDRLQSGYRLLHFHDCTGWQSGGVILVKITKNIS